MVATIYGAEKDVYLVGTQQLYAIGQKLETPGGDIYRYTEMGATIGVANNLYQSSIPAADWLSQALAGTAMAVGDTVIAFTPAVGTAVVADELAGGTVLVEETADLGHLYRIKSNPAIAGATTGNLTLEDGVTVQVAVAIAGGNVLTVLKNGWKDVIISPASVNTAPNAGVQRVIVAANGFGWTQTRGVASCLIDSGAPALLLGNNMRASESVAGAVALTEETAGILDYQIAGYALETAPDADFGHIFLQIE